jgi:hypothetical protein
LESLWEFRARNLSLNRRVLFGARDMVKSISRIHTRERIIVIGAIRTIKTTTGMDGIIITGGGIGKYDLERSRS